MSEVIISVVLPVYNGGDYLKKSVSSVLNQSLAEFELLIIDDCSTDGSYDWLASLNDSRIHLFRNTVNKGLFYNLNYLIKHSKGQLIKLWAQDDIMYPHCLGSFQKFHRQHPGIGFSYCERDHIDENDVLLTDDKIDHTVAVISTSLHARIAYYTGSIAGNIANVCINREALNKVGFFNEGMKISADFDMWVRLARYHDTGFIKQKLIRLRDHKGQLSRDERYYLHHVKEDLAVFDYLNSYVDNDLRKEGKLLMRNHKLVFYYTLMMKSFFKGRFKTGIAYARSLSAADNLFILTFSFFKNKMIKPGLPAFLTQDNHE